MDIIYCIVWLFISVFVLVASLRLGIGAIHNPGDGFMLFWASIFLTILTTILLGESLWKKRAPIRPEEVWKDLKWGNNIVVTAALLIYCLALPKLGYLLATFGLMIVLFSLEKMRPWVIILSSLLTVLLSYYLFDYLLEAPLPRGMLGL